MEKLSKEICFLAKNNIYNNNNNSYKDLILSPYYYWHFEKKLPVKDTKRAKKILPQMLQSSLPTSEFEYVVIQNKEDKNLFDIFVLDLKLLKESLKSLSVSFDIISSIGFTHLEFQNTQIQLQNSIIVSEDLYAYEIDNSKNIDTTLIKKDINTVIKEKNKLNFKYPLGNGTIVQKSADFIDNNFFSLLTVLFLLLSSVSINFYTNNTTITKYEIKKQELLSSQKFATHQVQLKYIMDNILELDSTQKNFRNKLKKILSVSSNAKTFLHSLEYDDGSWYVKVQANSKKDANSLVSKLKLNFIKQQKNHYIYESNQ